MGMGFLLGFRHRGIDDDAGTWMRWRLKGAEATQFAGLPSGQERRSGWDTFMRMASCLLPAQKR
jgi:hypothetical protein